MVIRNMKSLSPESPAKGKETGEQHGEAGHEETCRCKETSKMTPRELLKLMVSDLSFWKRAKTK